MDSIKTIERYLASIKTIKDFFGKKVPTLPKALKDFLVIIFPWVVMFFLTSFILLFLCTLGGLDPFSGSEFLNGVAAYRYFDDYGLLIAAAVLLTSFLSVLALPGLIGREKSGWNLIFCSALVSTVGLLTLDSLTAIISLAIFSYLLFQIKSYYK